MRRSLPVVLVALCLSAMPAAAAVDPSLLAGLKARSIGPAAMSGRIAAIDASNSGTIYVGTATGGVWKSVNGGLTWTPIFDDQPVASIGAVAMDPSNPDAVWVGTGEGNPRNSVSVGNGIYKSLDGGQTWQHLGLEKTERIHRVIVHPQDSRTAWVAALGQAWGENPERGVFKTLDGGKTWRKVLYVDERTGCADLVVDPSNPNKLIAAMWDYRRWPWSFRSGGPGSGLHVSYDGGESWKKLTEEDGLPKGDLGRIGLAMAASDPRVVYALVEAKSNALLRSDDGGRTWKSVNSEGDVSPRPFYFADIRVDPRDPNRLYRLASVLHASSDGGKTFEAIGGFREIHPDHHAMWIDPGDPRHILEGNDGGVYESRDRGASWRFISNLPVPQFYHVRYDMAVPYNVYGGLQDNGSWKGPSDVWENGGIRNQHWQEVDFGDGFDTVPDPRDPMRGYAMSQEGFVIRYDLRTGERKDIRPAPPAGDEDDLRFNWNAAIAIDPFDPDTIYFGSQYVHRSTDRGDTWTTISPDLTTDKPEWQKASESGGLTIDATGAENFTTLIAIAPSPVQKGVIWAGSDDGRLHVTRDGGKTWTSVEKNVRGVPENTWIPHIHPSTYDAGTAFVVFDNHRRSDWTPYVARTTDFGRTWTSLSTKDLRGYALSIIQDPVDPDLLFLGTEFGLWVSLDGGKGWMRFDQGIPTVSVMDLAIHPREHDLIVATHGRGLYIVDDIRPLRSLSRLASETTQKDAIRLFEVGDAMQHQVAQTGSSRFPGAGEFRGQGRPYGALITWSMNVPGLPHPDEEKERERKEAERAEKASEGRGQPPVTDEPSEEEEAGRSAPPGRRGGKKGPEAKIEVMDGSGKVIRTFQAPVTQGVNRAAWDLRRDAYKRIPRRDANPFRDAAGPEVLPGTYRVRVSYKDQKSAEQTVRVLPDPRYEGRLGGRQANFEAQVRAGKVQEALAQAVERINQTRSDIDAVTAKLKAREDKDKEKKDPAGEALTKSGRELRKKLDEVEKRLWQPEGTKGILPETDAENRLNYAMRAIGSSYDAPTPAQLAYLERAEAEARKVLADFNQLFSQDVAAFRARVKELDVQLLPEAPPISIE
ncbi:MAG: VPS10 domain-containing protein [Thermoanaerobaculia bacterium]